MKILIKVISIIGLFAIPQLTYSDTIADSYATGDTLTAQMLENIKTAVNGNDAKISANASDITGNFSQLSANASDITGNFSQLSANASDITGIFSQLSARPRILNFPSRLPAADDDSDDGFLVGTIVLSPGQNRVHILMDATVGKAVWREITLDHQHQLYSLGDQGPGSGRVFQVTVDGLHGKEAFVNSPLPLVVWGCNVTAITAANSTIINDGRRNTDNILRECPGVHAASQAYYISLNGYQDWYLPTLDELSAIFNVLGPLGSHPNVFFGTGDFYWSSSQSSATFAFAGAASGGNLFNKNTFLQTISVRSF